jgi:hypothetical protein
MPCLRPRGKQRSACQYDLSHLTFPTLVTAAVEGRLPRGIGIERLRDPPTEMEPMFEVLRFNPE